MNEMMMGSASAVVYADSGSIKAELFVLNLLSPQTVHRNFLDESGWNWADQGIGGTTATNKITNHLTTPMVLTFKDGAQARKIYAFTTGFVPPDREFADTGNLYANEWDGNMWNWVNHGNPGVPLTGEPVGRGTPVSGGPSQGAITYADGAIRQIHVFVRGNDGVVYMLHGNVNDQWQ